MSVPAAEVIVRCSGVPVWGAEMGAEPGPGTGAATPAGCLSGPPISVVALLRREGRGPHTVGRPLAPRGHSREAPPPSRRSARKAAAAAGALFAVGALIAPAVLHDAGVVPRADAGSPSTHGGTVHGVNAPSSTRTSRSPGTGPVGLALAAVVRTMAADPPQGVPYLPGPTTGRATPHPVFGAPATGVPKPGMGGVGQVDNDPPTKDNAEGKPGNGPPVKDKQADGKPGNGPPVDEKQADGLPANGPQADGKGRGNEQAKGKHAKDERAGDKPGNGSRGAKAPGPGRGVSPRS